MSVIMKDGQVVVSTGIYDFVGAGVQVEASTTHPKKAIITIPGGGGGGGISAISVKDDGVVVGSSTVLNFIDTSSISFTAVKNGTTDDIDIQANFLGAMDNIRRINNIAANSEGLFNITSTDTTIDITGSTNGIDLKVRPDIINRVLSGISSINGIAPTSSGNFNISGSGAVYIAPTTNGISINLSIFDYIDFRAVDGSVFRMTVDTFGLPNTEKIA